MNNSEAIVKQNPDIIDALWNQFSNHYTKSEIDAMIGDVENGSY